MTEEQTKAPEPAPSILDMLVDALALRIKAKIMEEIEEKIADSQRTVEADQVEGLDSYLNSAIDEYMRGYKIESVMTSTVLKTVERIINSASVSFEIEC